MGPRTAGEDRMPVMAHQLAETCAADQKRPWILASSTQVSDQPECRLSPAGGKVKPPRSPFSRWKWSPRHDVPSTWDVVGTSIMHSGRRRSLQLAPRGENSSESRVPCPLARGKSAFTIMVLLARLGLVDRDSYFWRAVLSLRSVYLNRMTCVNPSVPSTEGWASSAGHNGSRVSVCHAPCSSTQTYPPTSGSACLAALCRQSSNVVSTAWLIVSALIRKRCETGA
ncbi:hypothetical protein EK21DRAFT_83990 [Setomelanomma holmii]|uniref:Uncharacterized protein n=1 Tax=Setomelanomma holmii TaxID=210430 RepID=A0A9P4HNP3_9PLEO|nr:hypothetical protein EK21DRAFT_83990 [Setomelanomma holmii]